MRPLAYRLVTAVLLAGGGALAQTSPPPAEPPPGPPPAAEMPPTSVAPNAAPVSVVKPGAPAPKPVTSKSEITVYGTIDLTTIWDSVENLGTEAVGGGPVARSGTFTGDHSRLQFSPRGSRFGLRLGLPEWEGVKVSGLFEADFVGNQPPGISEPAFYTNPTFRVRHAWAKLSAGGIDVTFGQTWYLFGWVPNGVGYSVMVAGVPGAVYGRTPQVRIGTAIKTDDVNVEVAIAASKPAQRDSGTPDGQAGVRLLVNNWKGIRTPGPGLSNIEPLSIGVSGVVRNFQVDALMNQTTQTTSTTGFGVAGDILVPIIPAKSREDHQFALTLSGEASYSEGCADFFTAFTGGAIMPTTVPGTTPAVAYTANVDPGLVLFDPNNTANLVAIKWLAVTGGLQFYLTNQLFIAGNFSFVQSDNIADLTPTARVNLVYKKNVFFDGSIVWDVTPATRIGFEVGRFMQTYVDNIENDATRLQLGFWYFF